jgi:hypothetical protein
MKFADDIRREVRRHNTVELLIGVGASVLSAGLWVLSFWIWRLLFYVPLAMLGFEGMWKVSCYVAWGLMALLVIEGFRYARPLFDLIAYHQSWYYGAGGYSVGRGNIMGIPYLISQTLFCAPRTNDCHCNQVALFDHPLADRLGGFCRRSL